MGTLFLKRCTPRADETEILKAPPERFCIGVGVCNQKHIDIGAVDEIIRKGEQAIKIFGNERVRLNPDRGLATFGDNAVSGDRLAGAKPKTLAQASAQLRERQDV